MTPVGQIIASLMSQVEAGGPALAELLCREAVRRLPVTGVTLTLAEGRTLTQPIASSDPLAHRLQILQFDLGEGPSLDVLQSGRLLQVRDLRRVGVPRWPAYSRAVLDLDVIGTTSFPLRVGAIRLGVLDVYHRTAGGLTEDDLKVALHFADAAVLVLLQLQDAPVADEGSSGWLDEVLDGSLRGPSEVHQATGMVSVQAGVSLAEALLLLRGHAFAHDLTLYEAAVLVIDRTLRFDLKPDGQLTSEG